MIIMKECNYLKAWLLVAMSEEQQVANEVQGIRLPKGKSPMGESQIGKTLRRQAPDVFASVVPLCVCCYHPSLASGVA